MVQAVKKNIDPRTMNMPAKRMIAVRRNDLPIELLEEVTCSVDIASSYYYPNIYKQLKLP